MFEYHGLVRLARAEQVRVELALERRVALLLQQPLHHTLPLALLLLNELAAKRTHANDRSVYCLLSSVYVYCTRTYCTVPVYCTFPVHSLHNLQLLLGEAPEGRRQARKHKVKVRTRARPPGARAAAGCPRAARRPCRSRPPRPRAAPPSVGASCCPTACAPAPRAGAPARALLVAATGTVHARLSPCGRVRVPHGGGASPLSNRYCRCLRQAL